MDHPVLSTPLQGEERLRIPAHSGPITSLFVSPDGDYVATGGEDRRVIVWTTKKTEKEGQESKISRTLQ